MPSCPWPETLQIRGTVIVRVWWKVLFMTVYASVVVCLYHYLCLDDKKMLPLGINIFEVLGVVTGMMLVFRTNTSYERFWEGRKLWSEMVSNIRIITRTVWVMVDNKNDSGLLVGKISLLNLLIGFVYATKHYLREEYSRQEEDLKELIQHLPKILVPSSNEPLECQENDNCAYRRSKFSKETQKAMELKTTGSGSHPRKHSSPSYLLKLERELPTSNIPLEISFFMTSYIDSCKNKNLIDSPTCRVLDTAVANLVRCLCGFERIRRTPIPRAYTVHLTQIIWILLLMVPFQWVNLLKWYTIPATTLASFALHGILGIGREIENPFGYDYNDLHLDDYCKVIHKEIQAIIAQPMPPPDTWTFSESNRPIITHTLLSASTLSKMKYSEIIQILPASKDYKFSKPSPSKSKSETAKSTHTETTIKSTDNTQEQV